MARLPVVAFEVANGGANSASRNAIVSALRQLERDSTAYWNALPLDEFLAPLGTGWSPEENVRHLTTSVNGVARAMRLPRVVPRLLFGLARTASRTFGEMRAAYHQVLRAGGRAGRYAPTRVEITGDREHYRRHLMQRHQKAVADLCSCVLEWDESALDRYRFPHPLLGKLTVREMLLFTLYHNQHHVLVVARRRGEVTSDETPLH